MSADLIRASLSSTRNELAEVFPHLTDDMLDWAPAAGMRTIQGQFVEIIGTELSIVELMRGVPRTPFDDIDAKLKQLRTVKEMVEKAAEVRTQTLELLASLDEQQLSTPVQVSPGFAAYLELESLPVSELLRFIVRHESYHTGQLMSYLWARGDNPYSW